VPEEFMSWSPITETELWDLINSSWERMSLEQRKYWEIIKIDPQKWQEPEYGAQGGGFWVVAIFGNYVLWYNDIEDGFNISKYGKIGVINEYWCNQDELEHSVQQVVNLFHDGYESGGKAGGPQPVT
jgi:hypothetical protein